MYVHPASLRSSRTRFSRSRSRLSGSALISAIIFAAIIAALTAGIGTLTVAHFSRASMEGDYSHALDIAEAGINLEFSKITANASSADQIDGTHPNGYTHNFGGGAYTVYCANKDGTTPWTIPTLSAPNGVYIYSTGTYNGVSRTIKIAGKGIAVYLPLDYAVFAIEEARVIGEPGTINGSIGTNGFFNLGDAVINGNMIYGGAGVYVDSGSTFTTTGTATYQTTPVQWPTTDQVALQLFPNSGSTAPGGITYIETHNNNALASPPISGNTITGSVTLVGPGNFYVNTINITGTSKITLDNRLGPINVWVGTDATSSTLQVHQNASVVQKTTNDPTKGCFFYVTGEGEAESDFNTATTIDGNAVFDGVIYAFDTASGSLNGEVELNGNAIINGQVLADAAEIEGSGSVTVNYLNNGLTALSSSYYGFDNTWQEVGGVN